MNTNSLKTFIAVCEHAGFSAAAKELGYTQSTVSSQIKQLEAELQVRLFDRYYHRVSLTEEGILVLQQARNILNAQEKMLASLKFGERIEGEIRLAMSSSICNRYFKEDFLQFRRKYPGIRAEIKEGGTEQMFNMLRKMRRILYLHWTGIFMIPILSSARSRRSRRTSSRRQIIPLRSGG